ncbi:MAG TPA: tRNA-dihydrouridine synthase family protein [Bdellovibrionales bacterium]|nr:tRNA-dihydrouridine synthase family protein [Bdellovibrionales bacterium]
MSALGLGRPILGGTVNFPVCLAPMVGLSHKHLRRLVRSYLPQGARTIWPTEMLNSRRLPNENLSTKAETRRDADETDVVPQILGNEEKFIAPSVRKLEDWGAAGIDINMGCPVKKALKHNYGVALMGDAAYAAEVVHMTVKAARTPVSVKLRAGLQDDQDYLLRFVHGLQDAGASWITLHPRLAGEKRRGFARWPQIKTVREAVRIPVIGNGDIQTADDALEMLEQTGCDMSMVGRAMTARPWLLWQVGETLGFAPPSGREGPAPRAPEEEGAEHGRALLFLIESFKEEEREALALRQLQFFVRTGSVWLEFGNSLYAAVMTAKTLNEAAAAVRKFFEQPQRMTARTFLRA